jgi:hypothetical protein
MKNRIIIESAISSLIAITCVQAGQAQVERNDEHPSPYLPDSISQPIHQPREQGTGKLQGQVLMQINDGLINGWLSPSSASQYKSELNKLNDTESQYTSLNSTIPATLTEKNTAVLNQMAQQIHPRELQSVSTKNALHTDIDELISKALASNHISSGQAEAYYLRLAQAESNLESTKKNSQGASEQKAATDKSLEDLKSELLRK